MDTTTLRIKGSYINQLYVFCFLSLLFAIVLLAKEETLQGVLFLVAATLSSLKAIKLRLPIIYLSKEYLVISLSLCFPDKVIPYTDIFKIIDTEPRKITIITHQDKRLTLSHHILTRADREKIVTLVRERISHLSQ
jgi:hypothetical protein